MNSLPINLMSLHTAEINPFYNTVKNIKVQYNPSLYSAYRETHTQKRKYIRMRDVTEVI